MVREPSKKQKSKSDCKKGKKKTKLSSSHHVKVKSNLHALNKRGRIKRRVKSNKYSIETLQNALKSVQEGMTIRQAANTYGIPKSTLGDKKKCPEKINIKKGGPTIFSTEEEEEIVQWVFYRAERGFPVTKNELLDSVQAYVVNLGKKTPFTAHRPGRHWFESFRKRHTNLASRTAQHLVLDRAEVTEENLRQWFAEVEIHLKKKNLIDINPSRVFNCDETNIQLCPKPEKVLAEKGSRAIYKVVDAGEREGLTTLFMYSADGTRAPPMIMYNYKEGVPKKILENVPRGWGVGNSDNGWMTTETFFEYIANVFYPWLITESVEFPVILYLDGHASHVTIPLVSFCREKNIEIIALYPHSTHIMQPLDISYFHPFKELWKKIVPKWKNDNNVQRLKKEKFPAVLNLALQSFPNEKDIIKNGFKSSGLMPFNSDVVQYNVLNKKKKKKINQNESVSESLSVSIEEDNHLMDFEKNLPQALLAEFKNSESRTSWTGDVSNKGLFEYWLARKKKIISGSSNEVVTTSSCSANSGVDQEFEQRPDDKESFIDNNFLRNSILYPSDQNLLNRAVINSAESVENFQANNEFALNQIDLGAEETVGTEVVAEISEFLVLNNSTQQMNVIVDTSNSNNTTKCDNKDKENCIVNSTNVIKNLSKSKTAFDGAFLLPEKYLPKKKRVYLQKTGKPKLPSVGTSDDWWKIHQEQENKNNEKKELLDQKKKIAEEKKRLTEQMKQIQKKIKGELT